MHYIVEARLIPETAARLLRRLCDGTIESQEPDGREIVASMRRARIDAQGVVRWSEQCYCPTPLKHERETVYDDHFCDLRAEAATGYAQFEGQPLLEYLREAVDRP